MYKVIVILLIIIIIYCLYNINFYNKTKIIGYKVYNKLCDFELIENQHEIEKNLWLGDFRASLDKKFILKNNIKLIVNLSKNLKFVDLDHIEKYRVPINDNRSHESNIGMIQHFPILYDKINSYLNDNKGVLVHCRAGIQRSATLVALYLMKKRRSKFEEVKKFIRSKRCVVFYPLINFYKPIKYFESKL
tara:strand:+ start:288 stop:857 length:570 start_codon:yes stop_codon:yes gene_type:complete